MSPNRHADAPTSADARGTGTAHARPLCVKVCGLTHADDVAAAVEAGADLLGFNFYPASPRHVAIEAAAALIRMLPRRVLAVGIFVDPPADDVRRAIDAGVRLLQFHGDETADFCGGFAVPAMKALRVHRLTDLPAAARVYPDDWWLLADTADERLHGGTGRALAAEPIDAGLARRLFLAGGLTPASVAAAVRALRPLGVDVCSGVEDRPGRKNHALLRAFVSHAKAA